MSKNILHYQVQWGDTDAAAIAFYPNYFRWFDWASHEFLRAMGLSLDTLLTQYQAQVPIIEARCRFQRPVRFDDLLTIETTVTEVRTHAFRLEHRVSRGEEVTGAGYEVRAWVHAHGSSEGKLELGAIPDDVRARLL